MASTFNFALSTISTAHPTQNRSYAMPDHSLESASALWNDFPSHEMGIPMPFMTSHSAEHSRMTHGLLRSLTPATHASTASSDIGSVDCNASQFTTPTTPPNISPIGPQAPFHHRSRSGIQSSDVKGLQSASSDRSSHYNAFKNWCPELIGRAPFDRDYSTKPLSGASSTDYGRSPSHHSNTSSVDSWKSLRQSAFDLNLTQPPSFQSTTPSYPNPLLPGINMSSFDPKSSNIAEAQSALENFNLNGSHVDTRSILNSLAAIPSSYPAGSPANSSLDSQAYMNAGSHVPSLFQLYGLSPELIASRTAALSQFVNAAALSQYCAPKGNSSDESLSPANKKTNLYKTELCRSWEEKGTCRYGSKCQFAHGKHELKDVNRHPKFKTEVCRTFWLHGSCPYGKRCCFLHSTPTAGVDCSGIDLKDHAPETETRHNQHEVPTSRLLKRVSANLLSTTSSVESNLNVKSVPFTRALSDNGHSRTNSNSSSSLSSDGSSHIDSLRIQIWPRFGSRDQVPAQDAPGPRSRLQRLRPSEVYHDSPSSMPTSSSLSTSKYSPLVERPPHSACSDISSLLACNATLSMRKPHSANPVAESPWPLSRISSSNRKA